jgi:DNA polymerase-3 subunit epsilon
METEVTRCGVEFKNKNIFSTMRYYKDICKLKGRNGKNKYPKLSDVVKFLCIDDGTISNAAKKYFNGSDDFHDARYDTAATFLLVTEGIKQGYIPQGYFTQKYGKS